MSNDIKSLSVQLSPFNVYKALAEFSVANSNMLLDILTQFITVILSKLYEPMISSCHV